MSFFITAGSGGGYGTGSSFNNSNNMLNQMTNNVVGGGLSPHQGPQPRFTGPGAAY